MSEPCWPPQVCYMKAGLAFRFANVCLLFSACSCPWKPGWKNILKKDLFSGSAGWSRGFRWVKENQNKSIYTRIVFCHMIDDLINDILSIFRSLSLFFFSCWYCCCIIMNQLSLLIYHILIPYPFIISFTIQVLMWSRCVSWGCTVALPCRMWPTRAIQATDWAGQTETLNSSLTQGSKVTSEHFKIVWYVKCFLNFLSHCAHYKSDDS